jgi:dsRNA-specific ribonuclease
MKQPLASHLAFPCPTLGPSMDKTGANETVMAQLYEAAIGALYLERGFDQAAKTVHAHLSRGFPHWTDAVKST